MVCTGCALLCDDVNYFISENGNMQYINYCRKGFTLLRDLNQHSRSAGDSFANRETILTDSLDKASRLLREARKPIILGLGNFSNEAQLLGIELAKRLGAKIDNLSPSMDKIAEAVLKGELPTCSLDDVKRRADAVIYWGADTYHTHPRLSSRFCFSHMDEVNGHPDTQRTVMPPLVKTRF